MGEASKKTEMGTAKMTTTTTTGGEPRQQASKQTSKTIQPANQPTSQPRRTVSSTEPHLSAVHKLPPPVLLDVLLQLHPERAVVVEAVEPVVDV